MLNYQNLLENANYVLIAPCQVKGRSNTLLNTTLRHCTVLLNADVTYV